LHPDSRRVLSPSKKRSLGSDPGSPPKAPPISIFARVCLPSRSKAGLLTLPKEEKAFEGEEAYPTVLKCPKIKNWKGNAVEIEHNKKRGQPLLPQNTTTRAEPTKTKGGGKKPIQIAWRKKRWVVHQTALVQTGENLVFGSVQGVKGLS